jgi:heme exporter protein D
MDKGTIFMSHFSNLSDFFSMGGYAQYVWSAYGIGLSVLLLNIGISRKNRRKTLKIMQDRLNDASTKKT